MIKCNHCDVDSSSNEVVIYWCGNCINEHFHLLVIANVTLPTKNFKGPYYSWSVLSNIKSLKGIPKKPNII